MQAEEESPLPASRDAAFLRVMLVRFTPALIVVACAAALGWHERAPYVLIPVSFMVWGIARGAHATWKLHRAGEPMALTPGDRASWITVTIGMLYLAYGMLYKESPLMPIATAIYRIREWLFGM